MKKASSHFSILILLLFCLSCNKDNDAPSTIPIVQDDSFFKAKIDGVEYIANGNQAIAAINGNILTISSVIPDGRNFYINLLSSSGGIGTYTNALRMQYYDGAALFGYNFACGGPYIGVITITSLTENDVLGTFSFIAKKVDCSPTETKEITEGSFKLKINQN